MAAFAESQYKLIEGIVAAGNSPATKMATVQSRDQYGVGATVVFDGSTGTAQPVKCFESVVIDVGDRVGVVRYESEWIITGNYTSRDLADASYGAQFPGTTTTNSGTFIDMSGSPSVSLTKMRAATLLRISIAVSLRTDVAVFVEIAASVNSADGSIAYDQLVMRQVLNNANAHTMMSAWCDTAAVVPGGYIVVARWRRASGAAQIVQTDINDTISMRVQEVRP